MANYGSIGTNFMVGGARKPAISPKGDITRDFISGGARGSVSPSGAQTTQNKGSGWQGPVAGNIESAIRTYQSMDQPSAQPQGSWGVIYDGGPQVNDRADSWRDRVYQDRAMNRVSGGQQSGPAQPNVAAAAAIPVPDMPEYKPDKYAPPAEDPGVYTREREIAMGPGLRALREGTREAIRSSQSLDNPNARSKFIKNALQGYGQGLERVSAQAHSQATGVASRKRAEQLDIYRTNYSAKNDAYLMNYKNQINKIAQEYANQQTMAQAGQAPSVGSDRLQRIYAQQAAARGSISGYAGR